MSCTAVFKSSYAHLFSHWGLVPKGHPLDLSLAILGLTLYGCYFVAGCLWPALPAGFRSKLFLAVAVSGGCFSCYLLYVLKVRARVRGRVRVRVRVRAFEPEP